MDVPAIVTEDRLNPRFPTSTQSAPAGGASDIAESDSALIDPATIPNAAVEDNALIGLGRTLKESGYRFTSITPASHARVNARRMEGPASLQDVFGWSRSFAPGEMAEDILMRLADAGELETSGPMFCSRVRFSALGEQLFVHSAFPTEQADSVFFGPDTYRFARMVRRSLETMKCRPALRILDVGAGSGAGGLHAAAAVAAHASPAVTLTDINRRALRFSRINAALNDVNGVRIIESDLLAKVDGRFDLIISNPPYLIDPLARLYRHGGGGFGFELSLNIVGQGIEQLAAGGRLVFLTGSAHRAGERVVLRHFRSALVGP